METKTNKGKFKDLWAALEDGTLHDEEFGSDMGDMGEEEQHRVIDRILNDFGFTDVDSALLVEIYDHAVRGAGDYYYSEYAGNAPGSRSSNRNHYLKHKACLKNRVRVLCGMSPLGVKESEEIDAFLRERGDRLPDYEYAQYSSAGTALKKEIVTRFGFSGDLSDALVGVCNDRYGWGKRNRVKNDGSGWNQLHLEYAGTRLARLRSRG